MEVSTCPVTTRIKIGHGLSNSFEYVDSHIVCIWQYTSGFDIGSWGFETHKTDRLAMTNDVNCGKIQMVHI